MLASFLCLLQTSSQLCIDSSLFVCLFVCLFLHKSGKFAFRHFRRPNFSLKNRCVYKIEACVGAKI